MSDNFGSSIAVSGETAVVGAAGDSSLPGAAYIYVKGADGWATKPTVSLPDPAATDYDFFGYSAGVSGTAVIIGAEGTNGLFRLALECFGRATCRTAKAGEVPKDSDLSHGEQSSPFW
jgi:hypothetical protein